MFRLITLVFLFCISFTTNAQDDFTLIVRKIESKLVLPDSSIGNLEATFTISLLPSGEVLSVNEIKSSGMRMFDRAIERAINAASPLPVPNDPSLFQSIRSAKYTFSFSKVTVVSGVATIYVDLLKSKPQISLQEQTKEEQAIKKEQRIDSMTIKDCKKWKLTRDKSTDDYDTQLDIDRHCSELEAARLAKLPGVHLGMTKKEVLNSSSWGAPESVNRTIDKYGEREQWVYGGHSYLYFNNGILTTIQN